MKLIQTVTLTSAASSISLDSIAQDFTDLVLMFSARSNTAAASSGRAADIRPNNSTANRSGRNLFGDGANVSSGTTTELFFIVNPSDSTANTFSNNQMYFVNYTSANNKSFSVENVTENNATTAPHSLIAGLWSNSAPITSLVIAMFNGNFVAGTTVSLYGILKGSDGIVTTS